MLRNMTTNSRLITIEVNKDFVKELKNIEKQDNRLTVYQDGAENLPNILAKEGIEEVHNVISGIPFSLIPESAKNTILAETYKHLAPGGKFLLYQTSYKMVPDLQAYFREVRKDYEARNIPPMYLMEAIK